MSNLITSLRALAAAHHDDLSVAAEAADEIERQAQHIEELQQKINAEQSCACSYDAPGDVCAAHSPALAEARAEVEHWRQARNDALAAGDILKAEVERLRCISRDLLDTLSAAVRSGDFSLSGTEDMAEFVRQALKNLEEIAR